MANRILQDNSEPKLTVYNIASLFENIEKWGMINGIIPNGNSHSQMMKYGEEDGELAKGIARNNDELIKDSIGDAWVVMSNVIGAHLRESKSKKQASQRLMAHYFHARHNLYPKERPAGSQGNYSLEYISKIDCPYKLTMLARYYSTLYMASMMELPVSTNSVSKGDMLSGIFAANIRYCEIRGWDFADCLSIAFKEIKDRRGYLQPNGVFVKESDMTEEQKAMYLQDNATGVEWLNYESYTPVCDPLNAGQYGSDVKGVADYLKPKAEV